MSKPGGRYQRLQALQNLSATQDTEEESPQKRHAKYQAKDDERQDNQEDQQEKEGAEIRKDQAKELARKASLFGKGDAIYFVIGGVGAIFTGIMFPCKFDSNYVLEVLYYNIIPHLY